MDTNAIITVAPNQYEAMLNNYASIVEKTNNQLGLWTNPATLSVAILSALISLIAIFVAIALWKNSKEQKERINKFFSEQEKIIREKNKKIEAIESKFDKLINEYEKKLKAVDRADKESRKQIQETIDELKREKVSVGAYLEPASGLQCLSAFNIDSSPISLFNLPKSMICSKCGKSFKYYNDSSNADLLIIGEKTVHCTHCGAPNVKL